MISATTSCFPVVPQGLQMFSVTEDVGSGSSSLEASSGGPEAHTASFLYNLSLLRDKVHQVQSLVSILISPEHTRQPDSAPIAIASMGTLVQEIIVTASSMMFACQQMALCATSGETSGQSDQFQEHHPHNPHKVHESGLSSDTYGGNSVGQEQMIQDQRGQGYYSNETLDWFSESYNNSNTDDHTNRSIQVINRINETREGSPKSYDIVELDAADLLAKYTHYCQVCGKGFKRDANLRMHMRAHGDEYKTSAALANPMKHNSNNVDKESSMKVARKYSCPQEGCRWNQKHAKFQPLKSIICVKNHYKRSHCPKMYVCKRCNRKQFSVLSDLRTHEKHCGDLRWQCSCGTTFSRKDKLMGHVALFVGHKPAASSMTKQAKVEQQATQMPFHGHQ